MGNLTTSIIIFFFTLVVLHLLLFTKKTNKKFWIVSDYFWIALGFTGLIGATSEAQKILNDFVLPKSREYLAFEYQYSIDAADDFVYSHIDTSRPYDPRAAWLGIHKAHHDSMQQINKKENYRQAVKWYRKLSKLLTSKQSAIVNDEDFHSISDLKTYLASFSEAVKEPDSAILYPLAKIDTYINGIQNEAAFISRSKPANDDWRVKLKLLSPWLIAIALGLRLTKVTAQLKGVA